MGTNDAITKASRPRIQLWVRASDHHYPWEKTDAFKRIYARHKPKEWKSKYAGLLEDSTLIMARIEWLLDELEFANEERTNELMQVLERCIGHFEKSIEDQTEAIARMRCH